MLHAVQRAVPTRHPRGHPNKQLLACPLMHEMQYDLRRIGDRRHAGMFQLGLAKGRTSWLAYTQSLESLDDMLDA